jgi:hypothetical protein
MMLASDPSRAREYPENDAHRGALASSVSVDMEDDPRFGAIGVKNKSPQSDVGFRLGAEEIFAFDTED